MRNRVEKKEPKVDQLAEFITTLKDDFNINKYLDKRIDGKVKFYECISGPFAFICSDCIIERAKGVLGVKYPEILQFNTHIPDDEKDENQIFLTDKLAFLCLNEMIRGNPKYQHLSCGMSFSITGENSPGHGFIFLGANFDKMGDDETMGDFKAKIAKVVVDLGFAKIKNLGDDIEVTELAEELGKGTDHIFFTEMNDVVFDFRPSKGDDDKDDFDLGEMKGEETGFKTGGLLSRMAIWKLFERGIIKVNDITNFPDVLGDLISMVERYVNSNKTLNKDLKKYIEFVEKEGIDEVSEVKSEDL